MHMPPILRGHAVFKCSRFGYFVYSFMLTMVFFFLFLPDSASYIMVESSAQLFRHAVSIASFPNGNLLIVDQGNNTVNIVGTNNSIVRSIGGQGWGNESLDSPTDISSSFLLDMAVVDYNNRRIQRFDKNLHFIQSYDDQTITVQGRFQPIAAAISLRGELFVLDGDNNFCVKLDVRGKVERTFGSINDLKNGIVNPKDITVSENDDVYILDGERILVFDLFGNLQSAIPLAGGKKWSSINISRNILLAVSPDRILLMDRSGTVLRSITPASLIGSEFPGQFSDAIIIGETLVILSRTSVFRCVIP